MVRSDDGRNVPVVQAFAFGKYLGYLKVTFDDAGKVIKAVGNPILLDSSIPQGGPVCSAQFIIRLLSNHEFLHFLNSHPDSQIQTSWLKSTGGKKTWLSTPHSTSGKP